MRDPRDEAYARLLVETCIDVQPGWQVMVNSHALGRPLFEEVCKVIAERGAHVVPRVTFSGFGPPHQWIRRASDELLSVVAPVEDHAYLEIDALVAIVAPENTREGSDIEPHRMQLQSEGLAERKSRLPEREVERRRLERPAPVLGLSCLEQRERLQRVPPRQRQLTPARLELLLLGRVVVDLLAATFLAAAPQHDDRAAQGEIAGDLALERLQLVAVDLERQRAD